MKNSKKVVVSIVLSFVFICNILQMAFAQNLNISDSQKGNKIYLDNNTFYTEIPDDFSPITASDKELKEYGIPDRPSDPTERSHWEKTIGSAKWVRPSIKTIDRKGQVSQEAEKSDTSMATYSNNWAGYVRTSTCYGANSDFYVPTVYATSSYQPAASAQWVGLGGYSSTTLVQNGVLELYSNSAASYYAFYETIGTNVDDSCYVLTSLTVSAGDYMSVSTYLDYSASSGVNVKYYFFNNTTGNYTVVTVNITSYSGLTSSAEWIYERPATSVSGTGYYYLARPTLDSSYVSKLTNCMYRTSTTSSSLTGITSSTATALTMKNNTTGNTLATVSSLSSAAFTATWKNYN